MEQVIFNLLQNAVKYSIKGSKPIFIGYDLVEERNSDGRVARCHRLYVRDWGIGVRQSDVGFIFDEYRRGTNVDAAPSGTGLGLAVSKKIVEAHRGRLSVTHLKKPTVFAMDLPEYLTRRPPNDAAAVN
jgi:signal transduction histidine kinase